MNPLEKNRQRNLKKLMVLTIKSLSIIVGVFIITSVLTSDLIEKTNNDRYAFPPESGNPKPINISIYLI